MLRVALSKLTKNMVYASGATFFSEMLVQKRFRDMPLSPPLLQDDPEYKLMHTVFADMGADLEKKSLRISTVDEHTGILAGCAASPLFDTYNLVVSPNKVRRLSKKTINTSSAEDILTAITAHEAVHAIENHNAIISSSSSLFSLCVFDLCKHHRLPRGVTLAASIMAFGSLYIVMSKQMEYRADMVAAKHDPKIRATLIDVLMAMEHKPPLPDKIIARHPSHADRIHHLESMKP